MAQILNWDELPFKFYAVQNVEYEDEITLYQDEDGTIPVDLTGCTFEAFLRYEYDLPVLTNVNLVISPKDLANGSFYQRISITDLDNVSIESYNTSLILDVVITFPSGDKEKYYGYLIVQRGV